MYLTKNQQITPIKDVISLLLQKKFITFIFFIILSFMSYGQHIATSSTGYKGDIYHTGGNLGIGTSNPETLLHLLIEHNSSTDYPTIRLENIYPKSLYINTWDIKNQENLYFIFSDESNLPATKLLLSPTGSMALGDETLEQSAILQLNSTDKGLLIPRLSNTQIAAINSPAGGLLVYNTGIGHFQYYDKDQWITISTNKDIENFITTETDPVFTAWDKDYNDLTNRPDFTGWDTDASDDFDGQWGSLQGTPPNISIFNNDAGYLTNADIQTVWQHSGNITYLQNSNDFVGIGTDEPRANLHIRSAENTSIKLENIYLTTSGKNSDIPPVPPATPNSWQITNAGNNLLLTYQSQQLNNAGLISFSSSNRLGLGIDEPQKTLHLKSADGKPTIRLENKINLDTIIDDNGDNNNKGAIIQNYWDISLNSSSLNFLFGHNEDAMQKIFSVNKNQTTLNTEKLKVNGTVEATKFIGDGSGLTNVNSFWYEDVNFYQNLTYDGDIVIGDGNIQKDGSAEFIKIRTNSQDWYIAAEEKSSVEQSGFFIGKNASPDNTFYIANNGNIGIGTNSPNAPLEIKRQGTAMSEGLRLHDPNTGSSEGLWIQFSQGDMDDMARIGAKSIGTTRGELIFYTKDENDDESVARMKISSSGIVYVKNKLRIEVQSWKDDVFLPEYELLPIDSLNEFISENNHLPDIPTEQEIKDNGLDVSEMQTLQMQKIEELTLYIIELNKKLEEQQKLIQEQQKQIEQLQKTQQQ